MDDVLERAEIYVARFDKSGPFPSDGRDAREIIDALAAEIRSLRKDRERLDWLELVGAIITTRSNAVMGCNRKMIDFVMPARSGEGGA